MGRDDEVTDFDDDAGGPDQREQAGRAKRPAVARALEVLEFLVENGGSATVTDVALEIGLPKATAHRLCHRLEEEGFVQREGGSKKFTLSARMLRLGLGIVRQSGASAARHRILAELVERVGETCNLTVMSGQGVVYLDRVETHWPLRLSLEPGSRVPLHCTASGKLLLATQPKAKRDRILDMLQLTRETPKSIVDRAALERELQTIARQGYAVDDEEFLSGLVAVAVPVRDPRGRVFAAIACHALTARMSLDKAVSLVPVFVAAATEMAATFGE